MRFRSHVVLMLFSCEICSDALGPSGPWRPRRSFENLICDAVGLQMRISQIGLSFFHSTGRRQPSRICLYEFNAGHWNLEPRGTLADAKKERWIPCGASEPTVVTAMTGAGSSSVGSCWNCNTCRCGRNGCPQAAPRGDRIESTSAAEPDRHRDEESSS